MTSQFFTLEQADASLCPAKQSHLTVRANHFNGRGDITLLNHNLAGQSKPLIILLHGVFASHWAWQYSVGIEQSFNSALAQSPALADFVIAMPSDGLFADGSAYLPIKGQGDYEQWIVSDVIGAVREAVTCIDFKSSIYIAGLSMGGYGALRLGCKYPNIFQGISAHSAITTLDEMGLFVRGSLDVYRQDNEKNSDIAYWAKRNKDQLPAICFDCGVDDPLIEGNRKFHTTLNKLGVSHQYQEHCGGHEFAYWAQHIMTTLKFFARLEKSRN